MKKAFVFIFGAVLLFSASAVAFAADTVTYNISELNMKIDIPTDWITLTRDIDENDPNLKAMGIDRKTATDSMLSSNIYLSTIPPDFSELIIVFMGEDKISKDTFDFNLLSDSQLEEQASGEMKFASLEDCSFTTNAVYSHSQAKYVIIDFNGVFDGNPGHGSMYFTIINGQAIGVMICSFTGELTESQRGMARQIVDGITFTKVLTKPHNNPGGITAGTSAVTVAISAIIFGIARSRKKKHQEVIFPSPEASAPGSDIR